MLGRSLRCKDYFHLLWIEEDVAIDMLEVLASRARSDPSPTEIPNFQQPTQDTTDVPPNALESSVLISHCGRIMKKMNIKGRSPHIRHVSRTPRVHWDCLFERVEVDSNFQQW